MARVVLLQFLDNDAAEHFIESVLAAQDENTPTEQLSSEIIATGAIAAACATVEALIARPTVWCKCKIVGKSQGARRGKFSALTERWYKTERYGWYVHARCERPNVFNVKRFINNILIGVSCNNLLPELKEKINANVGEAEGEHDQVEKQGEQPTQGTLDSEESRQLLPSVEAPADTLDVPILAPIPDELR
jgi:hypothetical protein